MELLTSKNFNGVALDCYKDGNNSEDFWATREQIGRLLGYSEPRIAISKIHARNSDRLNKFSGVVKLVTPDGGTQNTTVYSFKGLLEICRFSNQPKANDVMDFLWNIADEIRRTGFYATPKKVEEIIEDPDSFIKILEALKEERAKVKKLEAACFQWQSENNALVERISENRPKVIFAEAVDASKDSILVGKLAKILRQNGIEVGQNRLFEWLRNHGYLMACRGERWNMPKQEYLEMGLFEIKKSVVNNPDGSTRVNHTPKVTGKGQIYFVNGFISGKFRV